MEKTSSGMLALLLVLPILAIFMTSIGETDELFSHLFIDRNANLYSQYGRFGCWDYAAVCRFWYTLRLGNGNV